MPGTELSQVGLAEVSEVGIIAYFRKDLARYLAGLGRSLQKGKLFPTGDQDARLAHAFPL